MDKLTLIIVLWLLYALSYVFSIRWFVKVNFLRDPDNDVTFGSFIGYVFLSLFGPIVCLLVFFDWFLALDVWMMKVKDTQFKPRHLIQFVPLIGVLGVTILVIMCFFKNTKKAHAEYVKYVWYNRTCYYISMFWHAIFAFTFF